MKQLNAAKQGDGGNQCGKRFHHSSSTRAGRMKNDFKGLSRR
jgi:hypothetical protein